MTIFKSNRFRRHFEKRANGRLRKQYEQRILLFKENPYHPLLHNHQLTGKLSSFRSINISGDYRVIFRKENSETYYFLDFGNHDQLYGK